MEKQKHSQQNRYLQQVQEIFKMQSPAENSKTWNKLVDWYDHTFMHDTRYKSCYDKFLELLEKDNASVLEIGCGPGNIAKYMLSMRADLKWTGIDYAPAMVERACVNCKSASFMILDARELKTWRKKFDALMIGFCLPYFSPAELCDYLPAWIKRVQAEGLIYLSFVEGDATKSGTQVNREGDAIDFYYYATETIEQALIDCGAKIEHVEKFLYPRGENKTEVHSVIIARRGANK